MIIWLWPCLAFAQVKEVSLFPVKDSTKSASTAILKPEILSSGFIDILNSGQVNASARLIRLYIGEPGKFAIPLSFYSGVSSNNFQPTASIISPRSNEQLVTHFINPLSGLANMSTEGLWLFKRKPVKTTRTGLLYQAGWRILSGNKTGAITDPSTGRPINFLNSFALGGLYFQTGAWEKNNSRNLGRFWLAGRYILCKSNPRQLKEIIPALQTNGFYHGWSLAWGVEVNNLVNIKVIYYRYVKKPEIEYNLPIYQFSFNYAIR